MSLRAAWGGGGWLMVVGCGYAQADWLLLILVLSRLCLVMLGYAKKGQKYPAKLGIIVWNFGVYLAFGL